MISSANLFDIAPSWHAVTRLGQSEIVLPAAMLAIAVLFVNSETRDLALRWMVGLALAALITLATKVAFIGWGIGWEAIDFTGISGHTMCAAATYPILFLALGSGRSMRWIVALQVMAWSLVVAVAVSRIMVGAHSPSEVVAGLLLGGAVSVVSLSGSSKLTFAIHPMAILVLSIWFSMGASEMPPSQTHSRITNLALRISGRTVPFKRGDIRIHAIKFLPFDPRGSTLPYRYIR
jgi:membrane-associated phospholipid phosphatase